MKLTPPELKLRVTKDVLTHFQKYCVTCARDGFTGINNYIRIQPMREEFLIYHMKELIEKVAKILFRIGHEPGTKKVLLKLTHADRITLSMMFKRIERPPEMVELEYLILRGLTMAIHDRHLIYDYNLHTEK